MLVGFPASMATGSLRRAAQRVVGWPPGVLLLPAADGCVLLGVVEVRGALGLLDPDPMVGLRVKRSSVA